MRALLALVGCMAAGTAFAVPSPGVGGCRFDASGLPVLHLTVASVVPTLSGVIDTLVTTDGQEVVFPGGVSADVAPRVRAGRVIAVRGVVAPAVGLVRAYEIEGEAASCGVLEAPRPTQTKHLTAEGVVMRVLTDQNGIATGVVLRDRTALRLSALEAARFSTLLRPGQGVYAAGPGYTGPLGRMIAPDVLGPSVAQAVPLGEGDGQGAVPVGPPAGAPGYDEIDGKPVQ